jgi:alcohol dehydrogenase
LINEFDFNLPEKNPTSIHFGVFNPQVLYAKVNKRKYLLVTSPSHMLNGNIEKIISSIGMPPETIISNVPSNPSLDYLESEIKNFKLLDIELVIAFGGGSCIDSAKVFARILGPKKNEPLDVMLNHSQVDNLFESLPLIAMPTTAGTGSEVTPFATIWDKRGLKKLSLHGDDLYPESALLFYNFCSSAPINVIISSALDAVSHSLDSIWNRHSTVTSNANANAALRLLLPTLESLEITAPKIQDFEKLALGSLHAGLAISETKTSLSHSISYPLTYTHDLPHGIACSFTLPAIIEFLKKKDCEFFDKTIYLENVNLISDPFDYFSKIYEKYSIRSIFKELMLDSNQIYELVPNMSNSGRVGNFFYSIDEAEILSILSDSMVLIE